MAGRFRAERMRAFLPVTADQGAAGGPRTPGPPDQATLAGERIVEQFDMEHRSALFGFALRLASGDRLLAEDIVQETLLRAWRHREALAAGQDYIRPWLFTVARNIAIDHVRALRARPAEVSDEHLDNRPDVDDYLDKVLTAHEVREAMAGLHPRHRAVLLEVYFRERSVAEAAEILGIPPGTVKSRTYYALKALRLALDERGVSGPRL